MNGSVQKWGNSLAVRIPKALAESVGVTEGSEVRISAEGGRLIVERSGPSYTLDDLLKGVTRRNLHPETDTGAPQGGEVW